METTDEVPDWAKVWLDRDVAQWLHTTADREFGGNVELCMNEMLRVVMAVSTKPDDPWAGVERHRRAFARGAADRRSREVKEPAIRLIKKNDGTPPG
jgi:hypothetical protein